MSLEFNAIYEHGILRPPTPLNLPESTEVSVFVQQKSETVANASNDPLMGCMSDERELVDVIVEEAIVAREPHPLRANG